MLRRKIHTPLMYMNTRKKEKSDCVSPGEPSGSLEPAPGLHIEIAYLLKLCDENNPIFMCGIKLSRVRAYKRLAIL